MARPIETTDEIITKNYVTILLFSLKRLNTISWETVGEMRLEMWARPTVNKIWVQSF